MKEKIIRALEWNRIAYDAVRQGFRPGMSEKNVKQLIASACPGQVFTGDFIGGSRSGGIEGEATDYILQEGDTLILDLQFFNEGVWSDTTRTFFIGSPTKEQEMIYDLVCRAKAAGEGILNSGVRACDIYCTVREAFGVHDDRFPHHAGHLFGTEKLIQPQFLPHRPEELAEGDFVTLEPGLYFKNRFGIRVEDDYVITPKGCEKLFHYTLDITDFIL